MCPGGDRRRDPADDRGASRPVVLAWCAVVAILIGSAALVTYALTHVSTPATAAQTALTSPGILATLSTVPPATFDAVGVTVPGAELTPPRVVDGPPPTASAVPQVLFVGAEYCPFCAAERWPLIVALSRFGRFRVLHNAASSTASVFPGTSSFSFVGASYSSRYLTFTGVELYSDLVGADGSFTPIARLTPAQAAVVARYQAPSDGAAGGTAPFVDIGGRMVATTSGFSPALLAGQSQAQIAAEVSRPAPPSPTGSAATPGPPTGQAVIAVANQLSAGICAVTGQQPATVCRSKGVRAADQALGLTAPPAGA